MVWFSYSQEIEKQLLAQVIYMVTGDYAYDCVGTYTNRKRKKLGIEATAAERLEIEVSYEFFKEAMTNELDLFMSAFANKNNLFPPPSKIKSQEASQQKDREYLLKMSAMMEGMERHTLLKMIQQSN